MIKEGIIFVMACVSSCYGASLATSFYSGIETGDWGIPLIPRAHSYNAIDPNIEFFRLISTPTEDFILSIQPMISSGTTTEEISFKPQWTIFKDVARHFDKDKFSISIETDCHLKIMDKSTCQEMNFKGSVCFHDPDRVSPDTMHLGFNKESTSKAIHYNVIYSNGQGSNFAKTKNGTHQTGIILLLDNEDMNVLNLFNINFCRLEGVFEVLKQLPFVQNTPLLLGQLKLICIN